MAVTRGIVLPRGTNNAMCHTKDMTRGNKFFCKRTI